MRAELVGPGLGDGVLVTGHNDDLDAARCSAAAATFDVSRTASAMPMTAATLSVDGDGKVDLALAEAPFAPPGQVAEVLVWS